MTPQFKWVLYSIIATILLNVAFNSFAEEPPKPRTCGDVIKEVEEAYESHIMQMNSELLNRCDNAKGALVNFVSEDGDKITIMCWKVQEV